MFNVIYRFQLNAMVVTVVVTIPIYIGVLVGVTSSTYGVSVGAISTMSCVLMLSAGFTSIRQCWYL